jgi:hypothetical protein
MMDPTCTKCRGFVIPPNTDTHCISYYECKLHRNKKIVKPPRSKQQLTLSAFIAKHAAITLVLFAAVCTATTCEEVGFECTANSVRIPDDLDSCFGACDYYSDRVNIIVEPGKRMRFSDTLYVETDAVTGDTWWFTDDGTTQTRQLTVHQHAVYVGSAPPPIGSPITGVYASGEKVSGTTADGVWVKQSKINIMSPSTGDVVAYHYEVYLAGSPAVKGYMIEVIGDETKRVVFTGTQLVLGAAPTNLILQNTQASVIATGDVVVERAMFPTSHVACIDIPISGKTNILKMVHYQSPATCGVVYPIHTKRVSFEIDVTACYALDDYPTLKAALNCVGDTDIASGGFFRIPSGCGVINDQLPVQHWTSTSPTCAATPDTRIIDLGVCCDSIVITCERQII